ncbi:MAG: protein O-mannosyl-transferase family [Pseudomonadota bacterium]
MIRLRTLAGHALICALIALTLYVLTMPRSITLEDAGLFQMVCHQGGIAHPPGYPLFTLLCGLVVQTPGVFAGNLVSAVFASLAVAAFFVVCVTQTGDKLLAYAASLGWALTTVFWSQAIIIEVYSLAAALFMFCWLALHLYLRSRNPGWWYLSAFLFGLGLANHWPLMLLSAPALLVSLLPVDARLLAFVLRPRAWLGTLTALLAGLTPYLLLLVRHDPMFAIFGEINSLSEFAAYVSRSPYADSHAIAGLEDRLFYTAFVFSDSARQLGLIAVPLIIAGLLFSRTFLLRSTWFAYLLLWLGSTVVLALVLGFEYSHHFRAVFKPYPVIAGAAIAFWFAAGLRFAVLLLARISKRAWLLVPAVLLVIAFVQYPRLDRSGSGFVEDYAATVLAALPDGAVLFVRGDNQTGPLGYLHYVMGMRPDIELREFDNLVFPNRLADPYAPEETRLRRFRDFVDQSDQPVFMIDPAISPAIDYGAFVQFSRDGRSGYGFLPEFDAWVDLMVEIYEGDLLFDDHEKYFLFQALIRFSRQYLGFALEPQVGGLPDNVAQRVSKLQQTFPGKLISLEQLLPLAGREITKDRLLAIAGAAEQEIPEYVTRDALALFYQLVAEVHLLRPVNRSRASEYFALSLRQNPDVGNPSLCELARIYQEVNNADALRALRARFDSDCLLN